MLLAILIPFLLLVCVIAGIGSLIGVFEEGGVWWIGVIVFAFLGHWAYENIQTYDQGVYDHARGMAVVDTLSTGQTVITIRTEKK